MVEVEGASLALASAGALLFASAATAIADPPLDPAPPVDERAEYQAAGDQCGMALLGVAILQAARNVSDTGVALVVFQENLARCQVALAAVEAARRRREEREQADLAGAEADDEAAMETLRADPRALRIASSAGLCATAVARSQAMAAILDEARDPTAAIRKLYAADARARRDLSELTRSQATPLSCATPLVARVAACIVDGEGADCATPAIRHHLALLDEE